MLAALWARLQGWLLMAGAVLLVLVGAYAAGGRAARRSAQLDRAAGEARAREKADAVHRKLDSMDNDTVRRDAERWVRDDKR